MINIMEEDAEQLKQNAWLLLFLFHLQKKFNGFLNDLIG